MKIAVFTTETQYIAAVIEDNGDEFELTRGATKEEILNNIDEMSIYKDVEVEFLGN